MTNAVVDEDVAVETAGTAPADVEDVELDDEDTAGAGKNPKELIKLA